MYSFEAKKDFEAWVSEIPVKIDRLIERLRGSVDLAEYKGELESIRPISEWILDNFTSIEDLESNPLLWDELSCYVGEVYRKTLDSEWAIEMDNEDDVFFKDPVVKCDPPPPVAPMYSITTMIDREDPLFILK